MKLPNPDFVADNETSPRKKNIKLAEHLGAFWINLDITKIERAKDPNTGEEGWNVFYKE